MGFDLSAIQSCLSFILLDILECPERTVFVMFENENIEVGTRITMYVNH